MTKFTINNKEYTHKELNLLWDFFTEDQSDLILSSLDSFKDDDNEEYNKGIPQTIDTIHQLWRSSY